MARRKDNIFALLMLLPWWVSVVAAAVAYLGLAGILPKVAAGITNAGARGVLIGLSNSAPLVALFLLIPAPVAAFNAWRKRALLDKQKNIQSIRELPWKAFEELVAEAYRRLGYSVLENTGRGPDGGVDIRLRKDDQLTLVQCKQWSSQKVGVNVVREMLGLITAESASRGVVICSGHFTEEAAAFARGKPMDLIDGPRLAALVESVQRLRGNAPLRMSDEPTRLAPAEVTSSRQCPRCGGELVLRTARRGQNAGATFLGCARYPQCRYTAKEG